MNHLIRLFVLPVCLWMGSTLALAADAPTAPVTKIGVLDWQQLFAKSPQAEEAGKRLEKEFQEPKEKLINKQKELQAKREKFQRDKDVMTMADRGKREKDLNKMELDLRRMDEELRSEYTTRHREETDKFIAVVKEVVDKLAQEEKYDLVIPQEATLFMADRIDVTEKVLQKLAKVKISAKPDAAKKSDKGKEKSE